MKIKSVEAFAIRSDLVGGPASTSGTRPVWTDDAEVAGPMSRYPRFKRLRTSWRPQWPAVGCLVTAADGTWGLGMTRYGGPVIAIINEHLGPLLVGESCTATEKPWDMMTRMLSPYGGGALAPYVVGAIGLALWDLKGKLPQRSANELLGGPVRERIDRYATGNDTDWYLESGFRATKLACPYGTAAGLGALDANEPFIAQKRQLVPTQAVARHNVDIFQPDIAWAGGMTGCLKITHIAEGAGLPVILHAGANTPYGQHFSLATANCPMGEYFVASAPGVPFAEVRLTPGMQTPQGGSVTPSDEPGFDLGLTLDAVHAMTV